ncbi:MAG: TlpA family protein disulfide reductase [Pseudanabaenaceae cyanobacterium]
MKVRYLATLAVVSLLGFGAIAGLTRARTAQSLPNSGVEVAVNPCAGRAKSVGAPLARELQGKPVVIDVFATWCPACKNVAPTLSQLKKDYAGRVNFVVLDVTNRTTTSKTEARATQLGLSQFLKANKAQTGLLTIVDPATGTILAQYRNNANLADYKKVLDQALAR